MREARDAQVFAILLAAGSGTRLDPNTPKQMLPLGEKSILYRSAKALCDAELVRSVVVVVREDEINFAKRETKELGKVCAVCAGGDTRKKSAEIGFSLCDGADFVLIHDAARCLIKPAQVDEVARATLCYGAASAVLPVHDTVKSLDCNGEIVGTVDRASLALAATPQGFCTDLYREGLRLADSGAISVTDDNMLIEALGKKIHPVLTPGNIKITVKEDYLFAKWLLLEEEK